MCFVFVKNVFFNLFFIEKALEDLQQTHKNQPDFALTPHLTVSSMNQVLKCQVNCD